MHAITSPYPLTLGSLKVLVQIYIDRDDLRIEELEADRRAGRPKPKELLELETRKSTETKEFETGFGEFFLGHSGLTCWRYSEVIDLTHPHTVRLLWNYHETDTYLDTSRLTLLRQIRIFKDSDEIVIHKAGKADTMGFADKGEGEAEDWTEGAGAQSTDVEGSGEMVMDSWDHSLPTVIISRLGISMATPFESDGRSGLVLAGGTGTEFVLDCSPPWFRLRFNPASWCNTYYRIVSFCPASICLCVDVSM